VVKEVVEIVSLPKLYCPFPSTINEHVDVIHRGTVDWARHFDLLQDERAYRAFDAMGLGRLTARTHPDSLPDELRLITDWHTWLFIRDDLGDESGIGRHPEELSALDSHLLDVLEGVEPTARDEPLARALCNLKRRLQQMRPTAAGMRRLVRAVGEHLEATLWEAANRAREVVPDLDSYVRMRPLTGGLSIVTELTEIVEGNSLPVEVREHDTISRLTEASHNIVCWANDILSLEKELSHGEVNNLVVVLGDEGGLTLQEAVDRAAEMHDAEVHAFVRLSAHLPSYGAEVDANLGRYLSGLRARMRGVLDWTCESVRYRVTEGSTLVVPADASTIASRRR
jgi:5-epi-alpha-selinene synthase